MKCRDADKWMDLALDAGRDGSIPSSLATHARGELEGHLAACPHCRRQWEALRTAELALRAPRPVTVPEGLLDDFRRRLAVEDEVRADRSDRRGRPIAGSFWNWLFPIGSVVAGVAAALVVSLHVPHITAPSGDPPSQYAPHGALRTQPMVRPPMTVTIPDSDRMGIASGPRGVIGPDGGGFADEHAYPIAPPADPPVRARLTPSQTPGKSLALRDSPANRLTDDSPKPPAYGDERRADRLASAGHRGADVRGRFEEGPGPARGTSSLRREKLVESENTLGLPPPQAQYGPEAPELSVSPALLVALRRPVALNTREISLGQAVREVSEAADVAIALDSPGKGQPVLIEAQNQPLWQVLERIARVEHLGIYPEENRLVLRAVAPPERSELQAKDRANNRARSRESRLQRSFATNPRDAGATAPTGPAGPQGPSGTRGPAEPSRLSVGTGVPGGAPAAAPAPFGADAALAKSAKQDARRKKPATSGAAAAANAPSQAESLLRGLQTAPAGAVNNRFEAVGKPDRGLQYAAKPAPDRTVWPADWGTLPERGFQVPTPEELAPIPPNVAANAENSAPRLYYPLRNNLLTPQSQSAPGKPAPAASQNGGNRQY